MNDWESENRIAQAVDLPGMDERLREDMLAATTRLIRARRRQRMVLQFAAVALAFVSGMITMAMVRGPETTPASQTAAGNPASADFVAADPTTETGEPDLVPAAEPPMPLYADPEAFTRAFDAADTNERLAMLRGAGDYELNDRGDVRTALAYYGQWVRLADESARSQYDETDTWLLASLKHGD